MASETLRVRKLEETRGNCEIRCGGRNRAKWAQAGLAVYAKCLKIRGGGLAPQVGLEPTTLRLTDTTGVIEWRLPRATNKRLTRCFASLCRGRAFCRVGFVWVWSWPFVGRWGQFPTSQFADERLSIRVLPRSAGMAGGLLSDLPFGDYPPIVRRTLVRFSVSISQPQGNQVIRCQMRAFCACQPYPSRRGRKTA